MRKGGKAVRIFLACTAGVIIVGVSLCLSLPLLRAGKPSQASPPNQTRSGISQSSATQPLTIQVNGSDVAVPAFTHVSGGQVMIPIRWIAGELGATSVQWEPEKHTVSIYTNEDFYHLSKLESFEDALGTTTDSDSKLLPLPARVASISAAPFLDPKIFEELNTLTQKYFSPSHPDRKILVSVINKDQSYSYSYVVYCFENHDGHLYVPMCLLEFLFYTTFNYNKDVNRLIIHTPDPNKVEQQLAQIEDVLTPKSPEEAMNLWGRGEQTRNGSLQYTALSPDLRRQVDKRFLEDGGFGFWVTGCSSPWVGPITVQEEKKISDTETEFTVTFPEITSAPPNATGVEKFDVEQLTFGGKEGWFITKMLQSSGYGLL